MKNQRAEVIYVGKAKNLRSRVSSYFNISPKGPKTEILVSHIQDFDFVITETEAEAFVLENNLIKKYTPKYNIRLRDDKSYPYVVVDYSEPFPRLKYLRNIKRGAGREVFGPFVMGSNISEVMRIITKSFCLRDCTVREFQSRKTPCLLYQMKQCSAPCVKMITEAEYSQNLELALKFFKGEGEVPLQVLTEKMHTLAEEEQFEHAAIIRDYIDVLKRFLEASQQRNAEFETETQNIDILAFHRGDIETDIALYMVRNGLLIGNKGFHFPINDSEDEQGDEVISFILQYYSLHADAMPGMLVMPFDGERLSVLRQALSNDSVAAQAPLKILSPPDLKKTQKDKGTIQLESLLKLAHEQAQENQRIRLNGQDTVYMGLHKLQELLSLRERPIILECYDVAIWQGSSPTASQIVFRDGKPSKQDYRYYHLKQRPEGNNDYAMMQEFLKRRLKHGHLPDVMIVDGGLGQVNTLLAVLKEAQLEIPLVGIAKAKTKSDFKSSEVSRSEERLIIPNRKNPYILSKNQGLFRLITQMRDEAHRFSRKLHHKAEHGRFLSSWLDEISGIGPKTKQQILSSDLSFESMKDMPALELSKQLGIKPAIAEKILQYLQARQA